MGKKNRVFNYLWDRSIRHELYVFAQQFDINFANKLTTSFMYYSYYDFIQLVTALLHKIKSELYRNEFYKNEHLTDFQFEKIWKNHIKETCFVAISDEAGASSHIILSILKNRVYDVVLTKNELCTLEEIDLKVNEGKKFFYIFDDFIGRGDQVSSLLIDTKLLKNIQLKNPDIVISLAFTIVLSKGYERVTRELKNNLFCVEMIDNDLYNITNIDGVFWRTDSENFDLFISELSKYNRNFRKIDIKNNETPRTHYSQNIPFLFFHCTPPSSVRLFWDDDTISGLVALKKRITRGGKNENDF